MNKNTHIAPYFIRFDNRTSTSWVSLIAVVMFGFFMSAVIYLNYNGITHVIPSDLELEEMADQIINERY